MFILCFVIILKSVKACNVLLCQNTSAVNAVCNNFSGNKLLKEVRNQDQTSPRTNTLFDDSDDIQRQLDNEARDRVKFGRVSLKPKTIWVFHFPPHFPDPGGHLIEDERLSRNHSIKKKSNDYGDMSSVTPSLLAPCPSWNYNEQYKWSKRYPHCGGRSQSPVNLPIDGIIKARGARKLIFQNFDVMPKSMIVTNDGRQLLLSGEWPDNFRPLIYGGAAHSRRYLFHSLSLHWPSEHRVGGLQYPMESQLLFVSAEYKDYEAAIKASNADSQALLITATLYKYSNHTHKGLSDILTVARGMKLKKESIAPKPLNYFHPPFKEYACYQGSLTIPPCTESVLWLVRARTLQVVRDQADLAHTLLTSAVPDYEPRHFQIRYPQPLNDRKVFLFQ